MYASEAEIQDYFATVVAPYATYDFRVYDEFDNGEFITTAKVDLIERGKVVHTEAFVASSEDAPFDSFSAYGNGKSNHAGTQARSYAWAWIETMTVPMEVRWSAEYEREMSDERFDA